jgi:hypothetical protein
LSLSSELVIKEMDIYHNGVALYNSSSAPYWRPALVSILSRECDPTTLPFYSPLNKE